MAMDMLYFFLPEKLIMERFKDIVMDETLLTRNRVQCVALVFLVPKFRVLVPVTPTNVQKHRQLINNKQSVR
jgi:hypothetical protein